MLSRVPLARPTPRAYTSIRKALVRVICFSMGRPITPQHSKIAEDPNRVLIERALALGVPLERIAKRFGYKKNAIMRYRDRLPLQLRAAIAASALRPKEADLDQLKLDEEQGILGNLAAQRARLLLVQDQALQLGEVDPVVKVANAVHKNIELVAKYLGIFATVHQTTSTTNVMLSADYLDLRRELIDALMPYPEARRAVSARLYAAESALANKLLQAPPRRPTLTEEPSYDQGALARHLEAELAAAAPGVAEMAPQASPQPRPAPSQRGAEWQKP
jgi:hypothetical protein